MMLDSVFGHGFTNSSIWTPEPSRRGTFGILSTCLLALGLCVWTALHLNLPEKDESRARRYLRKLSWMSLGILTPELIAFTAFQQYMAAKSLTKDMNALLANPTRLVPPIGLEGSNPSPADQEIELTNLDIEVSA
ncbi:hypothetical protein B0T09DRAFT_358118 [Sordaria sp. MPI-SDFR-AT-0083]|nr:hypothetical protein B0T09DRAFT_358118 [Sordaria sp. MPI-SDFR-AT-0083]